MSDAPGWAALVVSIGSLSLTGVQAVVSERRRHSQDEKLDRLAREQHLTEVRQVIQGLATKWRNSNLSAEYAVRDDNWEALLNSVKDWRKQLYPEQSRLLAYTSEGKTLPYELLNETVEAARRFEEVVEPIVLKWRSLPPETDPYNDKLKVEAAVQSLQSVVNPAISELDDVRGEDLIKGTKFSVDRRSE